MSASGPGDSGIANQGGKIERETRFVIEECATTDRPYQVLVPIANLDHAKRLVNIGSAIARRHNGELLLTAVATVPAQTPLSEGEQFVGDERDLLAETMEHVPDDVPAHRAVTIGHRIGQSIRNIAAQRDSDLVLMGWRGRRKRSTDYALGSVIDEVVEQTPCDIAVSKVKETDEPQTVLVPTAGGPHTDLAEDIAAAFAKTVPACVTLVSLTGPGSKSAPDYIEKRREALADGGIDVSTDIVSGSNIVDQIIDYATANDFDMIVIGATEKGILQRVLFGDIPETVGERFESQVLMVKKHRRVRSFARKWIGRGARAKERVINRAKIS